jgi:hypothetical protein
MKTVIGELQTEHKSLSSKFDTTSEKLEESALKSVRKAITKRVSTTPHCSCESQNDRFMERRKLLHPNTDPPTSPTQLLMKNKKRPF